jgi:endonuclease-3
VWCLREAFDSDVPKTVDELCSLSENPGVGPKMAFLRLHVGICGFSHFRNPPVTVPALMVIWVRNVGIGIDVYVYRITHRLKWHKPPTKPSKETR